MAGGELEFKLRDNSRELGTVQIHTGAVTAGSLPGLLTEVGQLRGAIEGITIGVMAKESLKVFDTILSGASPASPLAQRGVKWTVGYYDETQFIDVVNAVENPGYLKNFTFTIPTADLSLLADGQEDLDLTVNPGLEFVTRFENTGRSPYGGTPKVTYVRYTD
jgi:hypothetical protein